MDLEHKLEIVLFGLIMVVLGITYFGDDEAVESVQKPIVSQEEFDEYPLYAWKDTHETWDGKIGDIVKIRYRVKNSNTKIWVIDSNFTVVHEQSVKRDPKPDGTPRDFTWTWKLYKSERTQYIEPGDYKIIVGGMYKPTSTMGKLIYKIQI
tara:strand:+ start:1029 stop:1481 length:453 start_codon:yes stop_codon:yes gene_type:complete